MECEDVPMSTGRVELAHLMTPPHTNSAGNVHGGTIMKIIDEAAFIVASRHTRQNCVTVSVDKIDFLSPVFNGNVVYALATINYVANRSMEIGVKVEAENLHTAERKIVATAYLTFVALDDENRPIPLKKIIPQTEEEHLRYKAGEQRYFERKKLHS